MEQKTQIRINLEHNKSSQTIKKRNCVGVELGWGIADQIKPDTIKRMQKAGKGDGGEDL